MPRCKRSTVIAGEGYKFYMFAFCETSVPTTRRIEKSDTGSRQVMRELRLPEG